SVKALGLPMSGIVRDIMLQSYVPLLLLYVFLIAFACVQVSQSGRNMIEKQKELSEEGTRIQTELSLATKIQADMIPQLFPAFPERSEFDLYASMTPAKEVGGDFYDFYMIDDDHLGLVIADVSGKGVPAALFMMASKSIIQNNAMISKSPAEVLRDTNNTICERNNEEMFVTVWIGVLEISTGKLTCANAGHEYPVIKEPDGEFALYKDKHGFVIGGMEGIKYSEYELQLKPGSKIFVYTDGVPEATNFEEELFGSERMVVALNEDAKAAPDTILKNVRKAVDEFVEGAEQFDDITMLCLEYKGI
ncbi:MAG: PP2C family protein-serine/threonine phosphatase, partial [Firmicutes bacterium]|nr:PP2C family protein-serine/threonine phosphatase [Bacillota bacterium]